MGMNLFAWFLPDELIPHVSTLLLMLGGLVLMFGARRMAGGLIVFGLVLPFHPLLTQVVEELLNSLPDVVVWVFMAIFGLMLFFAALRLLFGGRVAEQVMAQLIVAFILFLIFAPFRGLRWLLRLLG